MLRITRLLLLTGLLLAAFIAVGARAQSPSIDVLTVKGTINPVLVDYIGRGIEQAEDRGASAVIIQMDTPGGLDTAMRDIIQDIVSARVRRLMSPLCHRILPLVLPPRCRWAAMAKSQMN
jgi:membrane-bound serine protease (ClpP class)